MKIKMKQDAKGAVEGGKTVKEFLSGQEYEVEDDLAGVFLKLGHAVQVEAKPEPKAQEEKPDAKGKGKR